MRTFIYILSLLTFASCNNQHDTKVDAKQPVKSIHTFENCFGGIDTTNAGQSIGCAAGTYKLINDKYVFYIRHPLPVQFDSCYSVTIDSMQKEFIIELFVFDHNQANLTNICTDVIRVNNPEPTRLLAAQSGQLIIGFSDPIDYYGHMSHHTSILIKQLVFIDAKTGEKIELKDELIWKVLDTGRPG